MFGGNFDNDTQALDTLLQTGESFDLVRRNMTVCGKRFALYFTDGLIKDESMLKIMDSLMSITSLESISDTQQLLDKYIPYVECDVCKSKDGAVCAVLSGGVLLVGEGLSYPAVIDARTYPVRSISEPENDKVLRGARVGFVETLIFNTALIRRHIRDRELRMKLFSVGTSSRSDVLVCYMNGKADDKFVASIEKQLRDIKTEGLVMGVQSLAECLIGKRLLDPFPKIRYTERPDALAASVMEGSVAILVDNFPQAMILPTSIFDFLQETDDYYLPPLIGSYLRIVRFCLFFLTMTLSPLWYLLITHPEYIPKQLSFIMVEENPGLPIIVQMLLLEFAVDGMKLAALNTPSMLSGSFSIIGGLLLGDFAVRVGWFVPETILYSAFVSLANFSQPSYELGYAFKFMRLLLLIFTFLFGLWGFVSALLLIIILIATNKSIDGSRGYLYPLIPFNGKALLRLLLRLKKRS